jgi:hypothetical protein
MNRAKQIAADQMNSTNWLINSNKYRICT